MSTYSEVDDEKLSLDGMSDELLSKVRRSVGLIGGSQKGDLYHGQANEKRSRREIANCNERRRMQSINSGFESLKTLLPTEDGEKLSKAAILQLTSKYIQHLVGENRRMRDQLSQLQQQQQPQTQQRHVDLMLTASDVASRKRKLGGGETVGGGGVYIGYFQQQQQQGNPAVRQQQLVPPQPTFQAVKPDYEQFVIEPAVASQLPQESASQPQQPLPVKSKRLEHLMMAIERIEGGSQYPLAGSPAPTPSVTVTECSDCDPACDPAELSPQQPQQSQPLPAIMISPFTPQCEQQQQQLSPDPAKAASQLLVVDLADGSQLCRPRAIPHKYLHRPQVVQANRSN